MSLKNTFGTDVSKLFLHDALSIETLSGTVTKPVMFTFDNGEIGICYSPIVANFKAKPEVCSMLEHINQFIHEPKNQYRFQLHKNQLLIMNNTRALHGRTSFFNASDRLLLRFWNQRVSL